jgi:hypothetical protein
MKTEVYLPTYYSSKRNLTYIQRSSILHVEVHGQKKGKMITIGRYLRFLLQAPQT